MSDATRTGLWIIVLAGLLAAVVVPRMVRAEMAPNFPPAAHPWLHELYAPGPAPGVRGEHCCDPGDCSLVSYRIKGDVPAGMSGYQVFYRDAWLNVPAIAVLRRGDNPTGSAVLCINRATLHVYCFVPGPEG